MTPGSARVDTMDGAERFSADDLATERDGQFLASALNQQRQRARHRQASPGSCANCGERCLPLAVYCDPDCRSEHEQRLGVLRRQGRVR